MKTIELTITQEDLERAQKESVPREGNCWCCCLVYQAGKRAKLEPEGVGFFTVNTKTSKYTLDNRGRRVTSSTARNWPKFVGTTFTLTEN